MNVIIYRDMTEADVDAVAEIEIDTFPMPWSKDSFYRELNSNNMARYIVAIKDNEIVGYGGLWHIISEMHITNIAVKKDYRGIGVGSGLVSRLVDIGLADEFVDGIFLEVRRGNFTAQNLYRKYGFEVVGVREKYYEDNREDAYIMLKEIKHV